MEISHGDEDSGTRKVVATYDQQADKWTFTSDNAVFNHKDMQFNSDAITTTGKTFTVNVNQMAQVNGPSQHWTGPTGV
jgi:hypothetical protein